MIVHLNGQLVAAEAARISPFDRGFIFGDGIYEGLRAVVLPGGERRVIGLERHITRMNNGLASVGIRCDASRLGAMTDELLDANGLATAFIYWQITRGTPPPGAPVRARAPASMMTPTVFGFCTPLPGLEANRAPALKPATVQPDLRWLRGEVKSISLLGNILASLASAAEGGEEAILVRDVEGGARLVTEGTYTNVVVVNERGEMATPSLRSAPILDGVTRQILVEREPALVERAVEERELWTAREVILIGTTTMVTSVSSLNGHPVGDGRGGAVARSLLATLVGAVERGEDGGPLRIGA